MTINLYQEDNTVDPNGIPLEGEIDSQDFKALKGITFSDDILPTPEETQAFLEILQGDEFSKKFNPNHDQLGRFASSGGWPSSQAEYDHMVVDYQNSQNAGWGKLVTRDGRALVSDDTILAFTASDKDVAETLTKQGFDPATKPTNLARENYELGNYAEFAPGRGVSSGLYVGYNPNDVGGYGSHTLAVKIKVSDLTPSPEQEALGSANVPMTRELAFLRNDAVINRKINPQDIKLIGEPRKLVSHGNEFQELKYNPYHDRLGRFASHGSGFITVTSIDEAINFLGQGENIMFRRPDQAVTMLHKLAAIAQDAKAKGKKAPVYDLCHVSVKGTNLFCADNVHIPRENMPQLSGKPRAGSYADSLPKDAKGEVNLGPMFVDYLRSQGHTVTETKQYASRLRASQNQLNGVKVAGMMEALEKGVLPNASIFTSDEDYVVDGHHRWAANVGFSLEEKKDMMMNIKRVDMKILDVLKLANEFSINMGIEQAGVGKAFPIHDIKFNPYHDRLGRFTSGSGLGLVPAGQGVLPGFDAVSLLNPGAFRQPAMLPASAGTGTFTHPFTVTESTTPLATIEMDDETRQELDNIVGRHVTDLDIAKLGGNMPGTTIEGRKQSSFFEDYDEHSGIEFRETGKGIDSDIWHVRQDYDGNPEIYLDELFLKQDTMPKGTGTHMLLSMVDEASNLGLKDISLSAERRDYGEYPMNGYYTWARLGFDAKLNDVFGNLDVNQPIWSDNTYTMIEFMAIPKTNSHPSGAEWWKEHGDNWHGEFDLSPESKSWEILHKYAEAKHIKAAFMKDTQPTQDKPTGKYCELPWTDEDENIMDAVWAELAEKWSVKQEDEFSKKFNPNHDELGRFASGTGGGVDNLAKKYPNITFDFTNSEDGVTNDICKQLDKHLSEYPGVAKTITYVGTEKNIPKDIDTRVEGSLRSLIEQEKNTFALTAYYDKTKQAIIFNSRYTRDAIEMETSTFECEERGWIRQRKTGVTAAEYWTSHEFGHAVMNTITANTQGNKRYATFSDYTNGELGEIRATFSRWFLSHMDAVKTTSGYGKTAFEEGWAEAFAQSYQSKNPSALSRSQEKLLRHLYQNGEIHITPNPKDLMIIFDQEERKKALAEIDALKRDLEI